MKWRKWLANEFNWISGVSCGIGITTSVIYHNLWYFLYGGVIGVAVFALISGFFNAWAKDAGEE
jgi:hypothetical protein